MFELRIVSKKSRKFTLSRQPYNCMKNLVSLIFILSVTNCYCQVPLDMFKDGVRGKVRSVEINYSYYRGSFIDKDISYFDKDGNIIDAIVNATADSGGAFHWEFKYDRYKRLISFGAVAKSGYRYINTYNSLNQLTKQVCYGTDQFKVPRYFFRYNKAGQLIQIDKDEHGIHRRPSVVRYFYDKAGNKLRSNIYNENGYLTGMDFYDYNGKGDIIKITTYQVSDGEKVYSAKHQYIYDKKGNWIERSTYDERFNKFVTDKTRKIKYYP